MSQTSTVTLTLKPCPFCGGGAIIEQLGSARQSTVYGCEDCGCRLETGETFNFGRRWNTRSSDHAPCQQEPNDDLVEVVIACCNGQMGRNAAIEVISELRLAGFKIVPTDSSTLGNSK